MSSTANNHSLFTAAHRPFAAIYADAAARAAATGFERGLDGAVVAFVPGDLYKVALQLSPFSFWVLTDDSPATWARLDIGAPVAVSKTSNYTATDADDVIYCDASGGDFTVTLMDAAARTRPLVIKNVGGSGTVTVDGDSSDTIDGAATVALIPGQGIRILPRSSSAWEILP